MLIKEKDAIENHKCCISKSTNIKCVASKCAMWKWLEDSCSIICFNIPIKTKDYCPFAERN